jgi:Rps23 Pro-64 3,4-dihydroxylase Tpa1-like proline 4-hydroxylase
LLPKNLNSVSDREFFALQDALKVVFFKGQEHAQKCEIVALTARQILVFHDFSHQKLISIQNQSHIRNQRQKLSWMTYI